MILRSVGRVAPLLVVLACTVSGPDRDPGDENTRQLLAGGALRVGDPCRSEDGWQLDLPEPSPEEQARADQGEPVIAMVPPGHKSEPAVGDPLCITSEAYPGGYYAIVCRNDADCPAGTYCESWLCKAECTSDSDCRAPLRCEGIERKSCICGECLRAGAQ